MPTLIVLDNDAVREFHDMTGWGYRGQSTLQLKHEQYYQLSPGRKWCYRLLLWMGHHKMALSVSSVSLPP
jgi:hypothetical protein